MNHCSGVCAIRTGVCAVLLSLLIGASSSSAAPQGPVAIVVDGVAGKISVNGGPFAAKGDVPGSSTAVEFSAPLSHSLAALFKWQGNLLLSENDSLTITGDRGVTILVSGNALIDKKTKIIFSAAAQKQGSSEKKAGNAGSQPATDRTSARGVPSLRLYVVGNAMVDDVDLTSQRGTAGAAPLRFDPKASPRFRVVHRLQNRSASKEAPSIQSPLSDPKNQLGEPSTSITKSDARPRSKALDRGKSASGEVSDAPRTEGADRVPGLEKIAAPPRPIFASVASLTPVLGAEDVERGRGASKGREDDPERVWGNLSDLLLFNYQMSAPDWAQYSLTDRNPLTVLRAYRTDATVIPFDFLFNAPGPVGMYKSIVIFFSDVDPEIQFDSEGKAIPPPKPEENNRRLKVRPR